jgi:hypothetical protein
VGPSAGAEPPDGTIGGSARSDEDWQVQMIHPTVSTRPALAPLFVGTFVGLALVAGGIGLAWLAFATPVVRGLAPTAIRPTPDQMALGALIWGVSLVAPPSFAIVGLFRLSRVATLVFRRPNRGAILRHASSLGDDIAAATAVRLPEGTVVRNLVVGAYGVAILAELPPAHATRRHGTAWEVHRADGRWIPLENPLERAARNAERVRGWLGAEELDYVVKVYAAVVTSDGSVTRTPACAVISSDQIPAWLASLPAQRSLGPDRRAELVERIRAIA